MKTEYFIGIVPPEKYLKRIIDFQSTYFGCPRVEPHITVKAQGGLDIEGVWLDCAKAVCKNISPFLMSLSQHQSFGENILYLSVESEEIYSLHHKIIESISPSGAQLKQYFEGPDFVPHLTLGQVKSHEEKKYIGRMIEQELLPYPTFEVTFVRIYVSNSEKMCFEKCVDVYFGQ